MRRRSRRCGVRYWWPRGPRSSSCLPRTHLPSLAGARGRPPHHGWKTRPRLCPPPIEEPSMPVATPEIYAEMLDKAKRESFAYPAINVTSSQTLNAALRGFAEAESDGIVQVSTGGAEYLSGSTVKDMVVGAQALAEYAHHVAKGYSTTVALHTDHCPKDKLDGYMRPLIAISQARVDEGRDPLFQS